MKKIRQRVYEITELAASDDRASKAFDIFILFLIALNVIEHIISTVPDIYRQYDTYFHTFENVSLFIFAAEYAVRFWACSAKTDVSSKGVVKGRLWWMTRWGQIVDLIVILPLLLPFFIADSRVLRVIRLFRFFRLFRLSRYSDSITVFKNIIASRKEALVMSFLGIITLIILGATIVYYAENTAQPDVFTSIPNSIWWAIVTASTVGYGDMSPITIWGRCFAGVFQILGIGLFAVPTGIIASAIIRDDEDSKEKPLPKTRLQFKRKLKTSKSKIKHIRSCYG